MTFKYFLLLLILILSKYLRDRFTTISSYRTTLLIWYQHKYNRVLKKNIDEKLQKIWKCSSLHSSVSIFFLVGAREFNPLIHVPRYATGLIRSLFMWTDPMHINKWLCGNTSNTIYHVMSTNSTTVGVKNTSNTLDINYYSIRI